MVHYTIKVFHCDGTAKEWIEFFDKEVNPFLKTIYAENILSIKIDTMAWRVFVIYKED